MSYDGFVWPRNGFVCDRKWEETHECGHGLHGILLAQRELSIPLSRNTQTFTIPAVGPIAFSLYSTEYSNLFYEKLVWQLVEVSSGEVIDLDFKCKFPRGFVVFSGSLKDLFQRCSNLSGSDFYKPPSANKYEILDKKKNYLSLLCG